MIIFLAPEDYAEVEDWGTIIGIVHSHPDATPNPANWTKRNAMPNQLPWHYQLARRRSPYHSPRGELPLIERPFVLGHYDCWGW